MQGQVVDLSRIPAPAKRRIALRVSPAAERALRQRHPWLFTDSIEHQSHQGQPGDLAVIFDRQRKFLAIGLYDPTSVIRVRILQHGKPAQINQAWFHKKIDSAGQIREALTEGTTGYRLIHGENDGLPGLVVDRYAQSLVIKVYTLAWIHHLSDLLPPLLDLKNPARVILRLGRDAARHLQHLYGLENGSTLIGTPPKEPVLFLENGITFEADLLNGQKTGFFLDQRENRARVEKISQGKRVLNVFAYTGGFSLYAARGGASEVISIDASQPALKAAERNFDHNQLNARISDCKHEIIAGDAFDILQNFGEAKQKFDLVIIDPPSFAKNQSEVEKALAAYQRLTRLGLAVMNSAGILVQASCSSRVEPELFFGAIHQAASQVGRQLTEIERTGHALDHPVGFPEGKYLKCLFARG